VSFILTLSPKWGCDKIGVPVDSQNFREKLKREKTPCLEELFISLKSY
jgi:hypothetical protein